MQGNFDWSFLSAYSARVVFRLIKDENPQSLAIILSLCPPRLAAETLKMFPAERRPEILQRIAATGPIPAESLEELHAFLHEGLERSERASLMRGIGGQEAAAKILMQLGEEGSTRVLSALAEKHATLAEELSAKTMGFADFLRVEERGLVKFIAAIPAKSLLKALKQCDPEVKERFLTSMSESRRRSLEEELAQAKVLLREVQEAQVELVKRMQDALKAGELSLIDENDRLVG